MKKKFIHLISSTQAEERLDDILLRSSSVSTSLLLVRSFSLLFINAVEGNLSVEPENILKIFRFCCWIEKENLFIWTLVLTSILSSTILLSIKRVVDGLELIVLVAFVSYSLKLRIIFLSFKLQSYDLRSK